MGTWNTKIDGNDSFQDIYQNFFEAYNQGKVPADISKQILNDLKMHLKTPRTAITVCSVLL